MSGYVRIHRTLIGHPVFRNDAEAMVFAWLITQAQWKQTRVRYKDHLIQLERGQLAISVRDLSSRFDRDKAWISRLLKRLTNEAMIETSSETGVTRITICNYNEYQADTVSCETPRDAPSETDARQVRDTEQRREKGKKEIVLPDWLPLEAWGDFTEARRKMRNVPFEAGAQKRLLAKLEKLRGEGHCPEKLLNKAVERGYRTVFEGDDTKAVKAAPQRSPEELRAYGEKLAADFERWGRPDDARDVRRKYGLSVGQIANDLVNKARAAH